jgi:hypothetical protein
MFSQTKILYMLIGIDTIGSSTYDMRRAKKEMYLTQAVELCKNLCEIKDIDEFKKVGFKKYTINSIMEASGLKNLSEDKFMELFKIPHREIDLLQERYLSFNINLDEVKPSFELHTTTKEQEVSFKQITNLCKELNNFERKLPHNIQYMFNGAIRLNDKQEWAVNPHYILNKLN